MTDIYIKEQDLEKRKALIERMRNKGFSIDKDEYRGDDGIIGSSLPLVVDMGRKTYRMMGNVTSAACAAEKGQLITIDEYYGVCSNAEL